MLMFPIRPTFRSAFVPLAASLGAGTLLDAQAPPVKADFVFLIDNSSSMSDEIQSVAGGLSDFAAGLAQQNVDARFAVVTFGTTPTLRLHFTADPLVLEMTLRSLQLPGGRETGLETIRMVLGASSVRLADATGGNGVLDFRPDARKNLILATDEDSDVPFHPENRQPNQGGSSACPLALAWQAEVDATAQAAILSDAFINLLVQEGDSNDIGVECQYGDFDADQADADLLNFDPSGTLRSLETNGFGASLEAQVLRAGLIGRSFDIARVDDPVFVANFFEAKIEEVRCGAAELVVYGNGTPGKLGLPTLSLSGVPSRGAQIEVIIVSSTDVDTHGCLLLGTQEANRRTFGFRLLVQPRLEIPILVPARDGVGPEEVRLPWRIPASTATCGLTYYGQAVLLDDVTGISATRGIRATIGN